MKQLMPTEHKLLNKAAEMQQLLLECYTDDEDSSDDEPRCVAVTQKQNLVTKKGITTVRPFRPPPGLASPDAALNPFAEAFVPPKIAINFAGFFSEDEKSDDEFASYPCRFSKIDQASLHDSTSAGESSDSDTESWSGSHSP